MNEQDQAFKAMEETSQQIWRSFQDQGHYGVPAHMWTRLPNPFQ